MSEKSYYNIIRNILLFFSQICTQDCTQDCLIRNDFMRFQAVSNDKTKQSKIIKKSPKSLMFPRFFRL